MRRKGVLYGEARITASLSVRDRNVSVTPVTQVVEREFGVNL